MKPLPQQRSSLTNLKNYRVTLTTAYEPQHGVSGHLFEMIEYFMHMRFVKHINACILISDGTSDEDFTKALQKYDLSADELNSIHEHTHFEFQPRVLLADTLLIVNGSMRFKGADIFANKKLLFRCSNLEEGLERDDLVVLQDDRIYEPLSNSVHYTKKMLFSKYKPLICDSPNVAMIYAKSNSKMLGEGELDEIVTKYSHVFDSFLLFTDKLIDVPHAVDQMIIPVDNMWSKFSTYIYTHKENTTLVDCSPRMVAECKFYGKDLIVEAPSIDKGLATRLYDMEHGDIWLRDNDIISTKI